MRSRRSLARRSINSGRIVAATLIASAVTAIGEQGIFVTAQGGQIEVSKLRYDGGKKMPALQLCAAAGLVVGAILGG